MTDLAHLVLSWPTLLIALAVFGYAPAAVLRVVLKLYSKQDARRRELHAELFAVPRWERPFWVAEQIELALVEGAGPRIKRRCAQVWRRRLIRKLVIGVPAFGAPPFVGLGAAYLFGSWSVVLTIIGGVVGVGWGVRKWASMSDVDTLIVGSTTLFAMGTLMGTMGATDRAQAWSQIALLWALSILIDRDSPFRKVGRAVKNLVARTRSI